MDTRQEISDLTCCRGLFAAWVFIYHVNLHAQFSLGPAARLIQRGYLGVDGFFVLSGLILARVHPELSRSTATARRFWGKRLARVYPVHLAIIVLLSVLLLAGLSAGIAPQDPTRFTLGSLIENLLLIQGWGLGDGWSWNYPSWSVSTEWAGYLLFPFLWFGLGLCNAVVLGQIAIICFPVLGLVAFVSGHGLNVSLVDALPRFLPEFIWGMCTARLVPIPRLLRLLAFSLLWPRCCADLIPCLLRAFGWRLLRSLCMPTRSVLPFLGNCPFYALSACCRIVFT